MNRRLFLGAVGALALSPALRAAQPQMMGPMTPMGVPMRVLVAHPTRVVQQCPFWCWAASISMVFQSYGHPVDQADIVRQSFNSNVAVCASGNSTVIGSALSDSWTDQNGDSFTSQVNAAYDFYNGLYAINNIILIDQLSQDRPLLYCNTHHAMVVVTVDYFATPMGPNVRAIGVIDPFPGSPEFHWLTPAEMLPANQGGEMTFLASVDVS
ncbi:MAG: hypothetical protein JO171_08270 [Paludibacterium sp.]|uniref:papain-like cysteine protease family protein n=1 Tax=Paludibacterium sp. TaxID=1917523 RepID=UPI0025FD1A9F|nr:papain-like cysteine protease family protein [Paludibacterium sp.]MBV8047132.1 hypothetical protein [Paludibacterium sp.]MBV8648737.1 hypothetical protein [Paludibacterium sp.]